MRRLTKKHWSQGNQHQQPGRLHTERVATTNHDQCYQMASSRQRATHSRVLFGRTVKSNGKVDSWHVWCITTLYKIAQAFTYPKDMSPTVRGTISDAEIHPSICPMPLAQKTVHFRETPCWTSNPLVKMAKMVTEPLLASLRSYFQQCLLWGMTGACLNYF